MIPVYPVCLTYVVWFFAGFFLVFAYFVIFLFGWVNYDAGRDASSCVFQSLFGDVQLALYYSRMGGLTCFFQILVCAFLFRRSVYIGPEKQAIHAQACVSWVNIWTHTVDQLKNHQTSRETNCRIHRSSARLGWIRWQWRERERSGC